MSVTIREAQVDDLPALTDLYNYYIENTVITFDLKPFSVEERKEWFNHYNHNSRHRLFVADQKGAILGYASSSSFRPKEAYQTSVETSVYLLPNSTGSGLGSKLYAQLFQALENADLHRAYAGITYPNPVSFSFHAKFDFQEAGIFKEVGRKFGKYHDVYWLEKKLI